MARMRRSRVATELCTGALAELASRYADTMTINSLRRLSNCYSGAVLVMHGNDDQIVPYADSAPLSAKLLANGTLKTYKGFPHGMPTTEAATINADLLAFIKKIKQVAA
jgi:pimeloyl-ACP methyl ester carboxylesterase